MATVEPQRNVYVGHRYVPLILGEWIQTDTYEGLSIVTYQGDSYTSKKRVPSGIAISNDEYWVITGNYNAQIDQYRQDVNTFKEDLNLQLVETNDKVLENTKKLEVSITEFEHLKVADDWFPAFQGALAKIGNTGAIKFPGKTTYNMYSPLVLPILGQTIRLFSNDGATIRAMHNGDCIVLNAQNENYSGHIVEGLTIQGPNVSYPTTVDYISPSLGSGIKMEVAYYCVIRDCRIQGFNYGVYLKTGIKNNFEGSTYIRFNQYGVYFNGGATNVNNFKGISIRNNRKHGVHFTAGSSPFPTHNVFDSCLIESNIAYPNNDAGGNSPVDSIGVYIAGGYDNMFNNCYFENHQYAIYITGSSDGNRFTNCRFNPSFGSPRYDKIKLDGTGIVDTVFTNCSTTVADPLIPTVESNSVNQDRNMFIDCQGFTFFSASVLAPLYVRNNRITSNGVGTPITSVVVPPFGVYNNPGEGDIRGRINGIGTTNAILNAEGYGEVMLGTLITAPTTITSILNLRKGQIFALYNYQPTHPVTIKASTDGINGIVLKDKKDAVLTGYSDFILFYVTQLGKIVEVGRNNNKNWKNMSAGNITAGTTSVVVNHGLSGTPTHIEVTPRGNVGSTWITSITSTSFTLNCSIAPTGAIGFSWKAEL